RGPPACQHYQRVLEPHYLVRLAEHLEVLAEGVAADVEGRQPALGLQRVVPHHAVVAQDEHAHASHGAPLHGRDEVLDAAVVQRQRRRALDRPSRDVHRLVLEPLHPSPPPAADPAAPRSTIAHWRATGPLAAPCPRASARAASAGYAAPARAPSAEAPP